MARDLTSPDLFDRAMMIVESAETSSLDWKSQFSYIEDIGDDRGYTAGIIGFCTGTSDVLPIVRSFTAKMPANPLAKYLAALEKIEADRQAGNMEMNPSHEGLDPGFVAAWKRSDTGNFRQEFRAAQVQEATAEYLVPAVRQAQADHLGLLGQFIYFDALIMHGPGESPSDFGGIRRAALAKAKAPVLGGNQVRYLNAFLDARIAVMKQEVAHDDVSRVETSQRKFLKEGNLSFNLPLRWQTYGDNYSLAR